ncbi:hypothetical protein U0070_007450, partial [Myodes glareolus]
GMRPVKMQLCIALPAASCQELIEVDDDRKLCTKHVATDVATDALGEEWKDHVVHMGGGNNTQGFLRNQGASCWLSQAHLCYRRRELERGSVSWRPKELAKSKIFSTSLKKVKPIKMIIKKPLYQEGKKRRTKLPKTQCLVTPCVLQHKHWPIALKNQRTKKNKQEAAEYAKLSAKRMKEAKENLQEPIAKR